MNDTRGEVLTESAPNNSGNDENEPTSPYRLDSSNPNASEGTHSSVGNNMSLSESADSNNNVLTDVNISEVLYSASSYHAMVVPVFTTMILAAACTVFINTDETRAQGEAELSQFYTVWKTDETTRANQSAGKNLMMSLGNGLVMISFICALTFLIVLLYRFRFMKCLIGYMVFSSSMLLGVLGGTVANVALEIYRIPIDKFTFYFVLWNFAAVGTVAIFYQQGIPTVVTQGYLVCTSVILAWQLSHFDPWTAWSLLVLLALYDLCAVLTPCGPLKALVGLMQQEDAPDMPGLLYEAQLPAGAERRVPRANVSSRNENNGDNANNHDNNNDSAETGESPPPTPPPPAVFAETASLPINHANPPSSPNASLISEDNNTTNSNTETTITATTEERSATMIVPLAIAQLYRLPVVQLSSPSAVATVPRNDSDAPLLEDEHEAPTPAELCTDVEVRMPANGSKIVKSSGWNQQPRYLVYNGVGELRRTLVVEQDTGRVMQVVQRDDDDDEDDDDFRVSNSIRLGLGDFIFYSVLVSKAAMYSFATFAACVLVVLAGMGATLILLSVYKAALPALPISIFLGVTFYLLTRLVIEPWIQTIFRYPIYV